MNKAALSKRFRGLWVLSILWVLWSPGARAAEPTSPLTGDTLFLRNGDQLTGRLVSIDPATGVRWRHPDALEAVDFSTSSVSELELARRARPNPGPAVDCRVHLLGGGEFEGKLVAFETNRLSVDTWFAGRLSLPRTQLRFYQTVSPQKPPLFEGPDGFEGWTIGKVQAQLTEAGQWQYRQGAFFARNAAAIARDVKLPDLSILEFDLAWQGVFHLAVALYANTLEPVSLANKDNEPDFGGFYSLQLNSFSADLLPVKRNEPLRYMGQVAVPAFGSKNSAHVEIRSDKRRKIITLLVDGTSMKQWMDISGFAGQGTAIRFVNQGRGGLKISRIRISEWDGRFDEKPTLTPGSPQDIAWLRTAERVNGTLVGIRGGNAILQTSAAPTPTEIPLERVRQLEFASSPPPAAFPTNLLRADLWDGGSLGFTLEKWDDEGLMVNSPATGRIALHPGALRRIQFPAEQP